MITVRTKRLSWRERRRLRRQCQLLAMLLALEEATAFSLTHLVNFHVTLPLAELVAIGLVERRPQDQPYADGTGEVITALEGHPRRYFYRVCDPEATKLYIKEVVAKNKLV